MEEKNDKDSPRENEGKKDQALRINENKNCIPLPEKKKIPRTIPLPPPEVEENNNREYSARQRTPQRRMREEMKLEKVSHDNYSDSDNYGTDNLIDSYISNNIYPTPLLRNFSLNMSTLRMEI